MDKDTQIKEAFRKVKEEMNDHLEAINENSNEISAIQSYLDEIEAMIAKLSERADEMELKLSTATGARVASKADFKNISLNPKEKEVFVTLYSRTGDLLTYKEIAKILGITEEMTIRTVSSLISKGVPVTKKYFDNKVYLILDPDFCNLQAREKIIDI